MQQSVLSKNGLPVRLSDERWAHTTEEHCELAGLRQEVMEAIAQPERALAGGACSTCRRDYQLSGYLTKLIF